MLHKYLFRYPVTLFLGVVIVLLSMLPMPDLKVEVEVPLADKWTHMVMYGVLTLTLWLEYGRSHRRWSAGRLLLLAVAAPVAMGGVLELAQAYLTTCRSGEWLDFAANSIGVCLGALGGLAVRKVKKGKREKGKRGNSPASPSLFSFFLFNFLTFHLFN